jgi:metacaspase-1
MGKGISLHIGVDKISREVYKADGALNSPTNDAKALARMAKMEGFEKTDFLLNEKATVKRVLDFFDQCAGNLEPDDTFMLTYSGHGGQMDDDNGDEDDGKDETWCLYDGLLIDDEIGSRWKNFKEGVRIIVISSSCHSRTSLRPYSPEGFSWTNPRKKIRKANESILSSYKHDAEIKASIIHLSACDDIQEASDGAPFSKFIMLLLKSWDSGKFKGNYEELIKKIRLEAGYNQRAGISILGKEDEDFLGTTPFKLLTHKT